MASTVIDSKVFGALFSTDEMRQVFSDTNAKSLNIEEIGEFYKSSITIVPLLKAFKEILPDNAGEYVHWGATSQDIVDTGLIL